MPYTRKTSQSTDTSASRTRHEARLPEDNLLQVGWQGLRDPSDTGSP